MFSMLTPIEHFFSSMMAPTVDTEEEFAWFSGLKHPIYNAVIHFHHSEAIEEHVDALLKKAPKDTPVSFWVPPVPESDALIAVLKQRGFEKINSCPVMSWEVKETAQPKKRVELVTAETLDEFYRILLIVFEIEESLGRELRILADRSPAENYLVYHEDIPVGVATLYVDGKVGCIFNVAILPEYQKKGCGSAIMHYTMFRAHQLGLQTLILNSSSAALKMYRSLGFEKKSDLDIYAAE